ncbi:hypothetical protein GW17_00055311, partial [Ensete ventricosum]
GALGIDPAVGDNYGKATGSGHGCGLDVVLLGHLRTRFVLFRSRKAPTLSTDLVVPDPVKSCTRL